MISFYYRKLFKFAIYLTNASSCVIIYLGELMTKLLQMLIDAEKKLQFGFTSIHRGESPVSLKLLDDFQYLQETTEKEIIMPSDITTILGATND